MLETDKLSKVIEIQAALVAAEFDLAKFMQDVVHNVQLLTPATAAVIELLEGDEMVYAAASGSAAGTEGVRLNRKTSLSGLCVTDAEMKISNDTSTDPRVDAAACARVGAASMVCVPLFRRAKAVGVLKILSTEKSAFSEQDMFVLLLMSNLLGSALGQQLEFEHDRQIQLEREEANKRLREFYSTLSHELRTPLSSMRASLIMLDSKKINPNSDSAQRLVSIAKEDCERLLRLVNDLLDVSKIEAGVITLNVARHKVDELVGRAIGPLRQMLDNAQITFKESIEEDTVLDCDADRTVQVLFNLVGNAIKFTPAGGNISLLVSKENGCARFSVADTGPGISEEDCQKLFQRFEQLDLSGLARQSGAGLGLSISRALVHQHGGEIGVNSKLGHGTTFWFTLPIENQMA